MNLSVGWGAALSLNTLNTLNTLNALNTINALNTLGAITGLYPRSPLASCRFVGSGRLVPG